MGPIMCGRTSADNAKSARRLCVLCFGVRKSAIKRSRDAP
ncbi:hypothetical protein SLEP1_g1337 [Rubroshorea leprosula]|uniref:Uncharacterized protein n=1 Tax=Rubroshorea leprosula TaxID=152421 RepID=A0AAV5HKL6_9ROSI|nr:hypothetical protein SLEP1_g1337 [Rubroshorea leprosula]